MCLTFSVPLGGISFQDEEDWFLLPYQKSSGLPNAIVAHISAGIKASAIDSKSLLVFSGGETRPAAGPDTEGASYFRVADAMNLWPKASNVRSRTLSEEFARDSFENLYVILRSCFEQSTVVASNFSEGSFPSVGSTR